MSRKKTNTTNFCVSKVSFEFQEISPELAHAKHSRIMKMFADALVRNEQRTESTEEGRIEAKA
jgi:hypothetical protein